MDPEYPEWYGYLNRRGEVLLTLKGGKWKGLLPRTPRPDAGVPVTESQNCEP